MSTLLVYIAWLYSLFISLVHVACLHCLFMLILAYIFSLLSFSFVMSLHYCSTDFSIQTVLCIMYCVFLVKQLFNSVLRMLFVYVYYVHMSCFMLLCLYVMFYVIMSICYVLCYYVYESATCSADKRLLT